MAIRTYNGNELNNFRQGEILSEGEEPLDLTWRMYGNGGNDTLIGANFNDTIDGGTGNDSLEGSLGNDQIAGREGNDLLFGDLGNDVIFGGPGDSGNDSLNGGSGNDFLYSGDGNDIMNGGDGDDLLTDFSGSDRINGGNGNDRLVGKEFISSNPAEKDTLTGGSGADDFVLWSEDAVQDSRVIDDGMFVITDFSRQEGDKIQVVGNSGDFSTFVVFGETAILFQNEIIGVVTNTIDVNIADDFEFI